MNKKYIEMKVIAGEEEIREFVQLLAKISYLGDVGANRAIPVQVDGDGSGQLDFEVLDENGKNVVEQLKEVMRNDEKIHLDKYSFEEQIDGEMETHYIGE